MKVEHEVFVVFSGRSPFSKHQLLPSPLSSHSRYHSPHIEIISHHTCLDVLSKAHFSTLLVGVVIHNLLLLLVDRII